MIFRLTAIFMQQHIAIPLTLLNRLTQVITGRIVAVAVVKAHVVGIHIVNVQVAVGVVIAIRLVVLGISQPPIAAVGSLPRSLLRSGTLHSIPGATATLVCGTSHVNNQVGLPWVVVDVLAQRVEHDGPVVLVARRPDLVTLRTRVLLSGLLDPATVRHPDHSASGISGRLESSDLTF